MTQTLRAIQNALQTHLLDPAFALDAVVAETAKVPRDIRLHIYANAYRTRFVEALAADYGMLRKYIGDEEFERLILAYIDAHPSRFFSLRGVGAQLELFLQSTAPYSGHQDLIELARFEWALCHAFDAANGDPISTDYFAQLDGEEWPALRLQLTPTLRCIELHTNVPELWRALNEDQALPRVLQHEKTSWLVWRKQLKLLFRAALPDEATALAAFGRGASFGDVCALLADYLPEEVVPQRAVALLQQWLQDELIIA